jgi:predicted nucleic acid-binding protein
MFLLDTVVLSELRKPLRLRNPHLVDWIEAISSRDLFVSVVTIGEIERGIEQQQRLNPQFAASLTVPEFHRPSRRPWMSAATGRHAWRSHTALTAAIR